MSDLTLTPRSWRQPFGAEPLFAGLALVLVLSLAVTVPALLLDSRLVNGENVWIKPIKFQVALVVYLATLAWAAQFLPDGMTARPAYRAFAMLVVVCVVYEMLWIAGASAFGVGSHYNVDSPLMGLAYGLAGIAAVILTSASLVYGVALWRGADSGLPPALQLALALGLILTFVLTVPVASVLAAGTRHHVGTPISGASVPLLGWSREVGDLRVAHFWATHALQVLPLAGWLLVRTLPERPAEIGVWLAAAGYVALVGGTFWQAQAGRPFLPL
jgi:hypothetical protein